VAGPVFTAPTARYYVEMTLNFDVADAEPMRDNSGSMFVPETAAVSFVDGVPSYINARGRRTGSGRYTDGGFGVQPDGSIPTDIRGVDADVWMVETVAKAMQNPAVMAARQALAARQ
jgi:hypothetical protein